MNSFIVFVKSYSILALYVSVHHEKSFLPAFFFKGYIDDLFDNLVSGKRNYCFGKRSGKNLYEPCMIHFPTIRYVTVTSPLFAYESLKPNYSQAFYFYQAFQICDYSKKYFTGFESQDVTYLPMIAQVSTLDFQQTYNITVDLWDSFLAWGDFGTGSPVSLAHCSGKMRDFSKSYMYIAVSLAFPFVLISSSYS